MPARNPESVEKPTPAFRSVAFMLSSLGYTVSRGFHQMLGPLELDPGEFSLLRAVATNEGQSQNALAERLHISPSWMVAMVDQLERRGLLARKPHARDRRVRNLHLTATGKRLLKRAEREAQRFDQKVTESLTETELQQLLDLLDRLADGLDLRPGAHPALRERG